MRKYIGIFLFLLFIALSIFRVYHNAVFKQQVTGYLKRATDAGSVELALTELQKSLKYIESNNLTKGYTSVFYETPDEDIAFWYQNLKVSEAELIKTQGSSSLEKTNVLLKLRESLSDDGKKRSSITYPEGISIYPHNRLMTILFWISLIWIVIFIIEIDKAEKDSKRQKEARRSSEVQD